MTDYRGPLIIANGGSQTSVAWYSKTLGVDRPLLYPDTFSDLLNGYCINLAIQGASNQRNIRGVLLECIRQQHLNPGQKIIVLLEVTFTLRKELWADQVPCQGINDGKFVSVNIAGKPGWWRTDTSFKDIYVNGKDSFSATDRKYFEYWVNGSRHYYNEHSEKITLATQLLMLTGFLKSKSIDYIIFYGNPDDPAGIDNSDGHLLDTLKQEINADPGVLQPESLTFTGWSLSKHFEPIDHKDTPYLGHPSLAAHTAFGEMLYQLYQTIYSE